MWTSLFQLSLVTSEAIRKHIKTSMYWKLGWGDGFVHTLRNNLRACTYLQLAMLRLVSLGFVCLMFFQCFIQWFDLKYRICIISQSIPIESLWVRQKSAQSGGGGPIVWTFLHLGPNVCPLMQNNETRLYVSTMIITNYTILRLFLD